VTRVGLAKGVLAITGIMIFLWAKDSDRSVYRWIAIGLIIAAWMLRLAERGRRSGRESEAADEATGGSEPE
jgi:hypothetical protein